jgi:hypothetical protein
MQFNKRRLAESELGYSVTSISLLNTTCVLAAAEGEGPGLVFPAPDLKPSVLSAEPGGCMGFAPIPGRPDQVLMISRFYPIFKADAAGVHLYRAVDGFAKPWSGKRIIDLPFVHRIATVTVAGHGYLIAATVCGGKDFEQDWSRPGKVYVARIPDSDDGEWNLIPVLEGLHKNHGMNVGTYKGRETVFIAATEGVYALKVPEDEGAEWESEQIIEGEISEIYPFDLDGDGVDELAVIEPFHGDTVAVYKQSPEGWDRIFAAPLGFGHGLWAGKLGGDAAVIVGNRSGTRNLCCYRVRSASPFEMEEIVIDAGSGTTNLAVVDLPDGQAIIASNPEHGEYAIYTMK